MEKKKKPENPDVFPLDGNYAADAIKSKRTGINLRDYFAAKALNQILAYEGYKAFENTDEGFKDYSQSMAKKAYGIADAMLKARENQ